MTDYKRTIGFARIIKMANLRRWSDIQLINFQLKNR